MKLSSQEFRAWDKKNITLLGMSGVGKTCLACILRQHDWFHYSTDYRIGTRYLGEHILDNIKHKLMNVKFLKELMLSDSLQISNNITIDNLDLVSSFLGKLGNPAAGGLGLTEFKRRQSLHCQAEISTMRDVPEFIKRAQHIYGYNHFINDAGGSLCEIDNTEIFDTLYEHTLVIYIKATKDDEQSLIKRAETAPKPLYYREIFLDEQLAIYMEARKIEYVALIDPDNFIRWLFPHLFNARLPRYQAIADKYGYVVSMEEIAKVNDEADFINLIADVLAR